MSTMPGSLEEIQDAILDRLHAGEVLDRPALLARHPEHAEALRRFFDLVDVLEAPPSTAGAPPTRLGEFQIVRELGRGGMGVVYAARQASLNRSVALKVLPPALRRDERLHARFRREAEAAGRLRHPNIVPVYSIGESAGAPFFTMELVDGRSLAEVIRARRAGQDAGLPPAGDGWRRWVIETLARVGDALQYAHGAGILHRDVKPANILLEHDGTPRLTDFGLALDLQASELTHTGEIFGSPLYMSPEQAFRREQPVDARTDVYSLAVTLYEALTLRLPYAGSTQADLLSALSDGLIVPPREADPQISEPLERVLLRALRRDPLERYASAADFVADLRLALERPEAVAAPRFGSREPRELRKSREAREAQGSQDPRGARGAARAGSGASASGTHAATAVREAPPSFGERHPIAHRVLVAFFITAAVFGGLMIVLLFSNREEQARRAGTPLAMSTGVDQESRAPTLETLMLLGGDVTSQGESPDGAGVLSQWLRPDFRARSVVSRTEPSQLEFGFSAASLEDVPTPPGDPPLVLFWWPTVTVNGITWDGSAHGESLLVPKEFVGSGRRLARFPVDLVLGKLSALDAVTVVPHIHFVLSRASTEASVTPAAPSPPAPSAPGAPGAPPASGEPGASTGLWIAAESPRPVPEGGTRWTWDGPPQTLFLYDRFPADYPRAVADAATDEAMRLACTPSAIRDARALGGSDQRQIELTLQFDGGHARPVAGAFEVDILLPGSEHVLASANLVLGAGAQGSAADLFRFSQGYELTGPPSEDEQTLLFGLQAGHGARVRVRLRGSRDIALREPGLDAYWDGTLDVEVPVLGAGESLPH